MWERLQSSVVNPQRISVLCASVSFYCYTLNLIKHWGCTQHRVFCHPALLHNSSVELSRRQQHKETHEGHRSCLPVGLDLGWTAWRREEATWWADPSRLWWMEGANICSQRARASRTLEEELFWDGGTARTDIQLNPAISRNGFSTNTVFYLHYVLSLTELLHTHKHSLLMYISVSCLLSLCVSLTRRAQLLKLCLVWTWWSPVWNKHSSCILEKKIKMESVHFTLRIFPGLFQNVSEPRGGRKQLSLPEVQLKMVLVFLSPW